MIYETIEISGACQECRDGGDGRGHFACDPYAVDRYAARGWALVGESYEDGGWVATLERETLYRIEPIGGALRLEKLARIVGTETGEVRWQGPAAEAPAEVERATVAALALRATAKLSAYRDAEDMRRKRELVDPYLEWAAARAAETDVA